MSSNDPAADVHSEHEDHPWTIEIPDHPPRTDSAEYVASRKAMNTMAKSITGLLYGDAPYQDHHGGGLWLQDEDGWFVVRNLAGIEWSAQFCADPAKVDLLRQNARRLYAAFPDTVAELGIQDLLDTPITDSDGIAKWTDSICNASMPLEPAYHTGVLPKAKTGGLHHYPSPIAEIELFKRDNFRLWVTDESGTLAAVVPVAPRGSGDGRVRVLLAATPGDVGATGPISRLGPAQGQDEGLMLGLPGEPLEDPTILPADHPLARAAFAKQDLEGTSGKRRPR
jgi:Family of unknown function (DUF6424)